MANLIKLSELEWQEKVKHFLSDPARIFKTLSGKRLQILAPGTHNKFEGPDFLDMAILLDGTIVVGNAEFHINASDWHKHKHGDSSYYDNVILHIILNNDAETDLDTLVLDSEELLNSTLPNNEDKGDINNIEDIQHFALSRLLRKTVEAQKLLNQMGLQDTIKRSISDFLNRYNQKRRRPVYKGGDFNTIINNVAETEVARLLERLSNSAEISVPDEMSQILKQKIGNEGSSLRREILLNSILPIALCVADESSRIGLFLWFWSTPALGQYGILRRKFPELPQNFLWQQQGLLEYLKEYGNKSAVKEALSEYGFGEVLNFYRQGRSPFQNYFYEDEN